MTNEVDDSPIGIGFEKLDRDCFDPNKCYGYMRELGIKWVRIQSGWLKTEKVKGVYDFAWLDEIVENLLAIGTRPWLCLCYGNDLYDPLAIRKIGGIGRPPIHIAEMMNAWLDYVKATVTHYKGKVSNFEIWNEPDGLHCWKHGVSGTEYGIFARETAKVIKAVDSKINVFAGSMCNYMRDICDFGKKVDLGKDKKMYDGVVGIDGNFFEDMMAQGVAPYIDYITYHKYNVYPEWNFDLCYKSMRDTIDKYDSRIGLIQGESGAHSSYSSKGAVNSADWNEDKQCKFILRRMITDIMSGVKFTSLFSMVDMYENLSEKDELRHRDHFGFYGVLEAEFDNLGYQTGEYSRKPSFVTMQTLAAVFKDKFDQVELPISFELVDNSYWGSTDIDETSDMCGKLYHYGMAKANGARALIYYKATPLMTTTYNGTASMKINGLDGDIKLIDMLDGTAYEIESSHIEKLEDGSTLLKNIPLLDRPLILSFGNFVEIE